MNKIISFSLCIFMAIYFLVASYGSVATEAGKAVELLFVVLATQWVMYGIVINNIKELHEKIDHHS